MKLSSIITGQIKDEIILRTTKLLQCPICQREYKRKEVIPNSMNVDAIIECVCGYKSDWRKWGLRNEIIGS